MTRRAFIETGAAYVLLAPAIVLLLVWFVYPIVSSILLGFQKVNIFHYSQRHFVGFENYRELFSDPLFHSTIRITLIFVLVVVPLQTIISLLLALLVNSARRASGFFRTAYFVPYVTSAVAVTAVFMNLFTTHELLPRLFAMFGLPDASWYANVKLALPFLAIVYVWMSVGLYMVIFLTGLLSVPKELPEAATVDGAGQFQTFWHVTLPSLRPFTFFVVLSGMIQAFQIFDQAYVVASGTILGGPAGATSTIVIYIFAEAFRYNKLGVASAAAVILLVVISASTAVMRMIFKGESAVGE